MSVNDFNPDTFIAWLAFSDEIEREVKRRFPQHAGCAVLIGIRLSKDCTVEGSESATIAKQHTMRETMLYDPAEFAIKVEEALHRYEQR